MPPALGTGQPGVDQRLLMLRHGQQQGRTIGTHLGRPPAELRKALAPHRRDPQPGQQAQGLLQRRVQGDTEAQQAPAESDGCQGCPHQGEAQPAQTGAEQGLQPGLLRGLIKAEPPAGPGQVKAPPLPLQPLPPGNGRPRSGAHGLILLTCRRTISACTRP